MNYDVVDLGTKQGNAIAECLRVIDGLSFGGKSPAKFEWLSHLKSQLKPKRCLGIERKEGEDYRQAVQSRGYEFAIGNLADPRDVKNLPKSRVYLAWNILEHLPDKATSCSVVQAMLDKATDLVWLRLPSFEQDETGEAPLRKLGLRFTWTHWRGHPTAFLLEDAKMAYEDWRTRNHDRPFEVVVKPVWRICGSNDLHVVPIQAPIDTTKYSFALGPKPQAEFSPPIVAEWDMFIYFKKENLCTSST